MAELLGTCFRVVKVGRSFLVGDLAWRCWGGWVVGCQVSTCQKTTTASFKSLQNEFPNWMVEKIGGNLDGQHNHCSHSENVYSEEYCKVFIMEVADIYDKIKISMQSSLSVVNVNQCIKSGSDKMVSNLGASTCSESSNV
jgi:hypothetical protein